MIECKTLTSMSGLVGFICPDEFWDDYQLYLDWIAAQNMHPIILWDTDHEEAVGFGGVYEAEWGLTAAMIPGENLKNPLAFFRTMEYTLERLKAGGRPLYVHNTQGSHSHRIMRRLGFEWVEAFQADNGTIYRWRTIGDANGR